MSPDVPDVPDDSGYGFGGEDHARMTRSGAVSWRLRWVPEMLSGLTGVLRSIPLLDGKGSDNATPRGSQEGKEPANC
jgi:hypothetical protein